MLSSIVSPASAARPSARRWTARATSPSRDWGIIWPLLALVALATVIRIITIGDQSFWADEALTGYEASLPFGAMLHTVMHVEVTPPLYFVLIWGWAKVFGTSDVALRSFSLVAGVALVPLTYLAARELFSRRAGLLAAAFVTVSPFMVWYSQEARAYMLLMLLSTAAFVAFIRAWHEPTRRNLGWWVGCSGLALMTHFFAGFAIAPEALLLLWRWRRREVVVALAAVAAVQAALLPLVLSDTTGKGTGWIAAQPKLTRIGQGALDWNVNLLYRTIPVRDGLIGTGVLLVIVTVLVNWRRDRATREGVRLAASIAGFVILVPLALSFVGQDFWISRNLVAGFIPLITIMAAACVNPRARMAGGALAVALLAIFFYATIDVQTTPSLQRPDFRAVARALGPASVPRMMVSTGGDSADALKFYLPGVSWVQPQRRMRVIDEIDVIGGLKFVHLVGNRAVASAAGTATRHRPRAGLALPRRVAPPGTVLLWRRRVATWIVARYKLVHPVRTDVLGLLAMLPKFFAQTPRSVLVFDQGVTH